MTLIRLRNRLGGVRFLAVAAAVAVTLVWAASARAVIVLNDNFSTSTLNSATNSPTSTSTNYDVLSAKVSTNSIGTNDLKMSMAATTSGVTEAQALFSPTPIALGVGDNIELVATFVNTAGINNSGSAQVAFGLFNSGTSAPKNNLASNGLSTATTDAAGGAADWKGYSVQLFVTGGSSARFLSRTNQTAGDNTNQDLLTSNASASTSYHNPAGTALASSSTASVTLTAGATYTEDLKYTLTGAGTYSLSSILKDATNTAVSTFSVTGISPANLVTSFDSLAIGWRETVSGAASTMDITSIQVLTSVSSVPEISSFLMVGAIGVVGVVVHRMRRRDSLELSAAA